MAGSCTSCAAPWSTRIVCRWLELLKWTRSEIPYPDQGRPASGRPGPQPCRQTADHRRGGGCRPNTGPGRIRLDRPPRLPSAASIAGFYIGGAVCAWCHDRQRRAAGLSQPQAAQSINARVVGSMAAHIVCCPWIHRVFCQSEALGLGHLPRYASGAISPPVISTSSSFRWNRRRIPAPPSTTLVSSDDNASVTLPTATFCRPSASGRRGEKSCPGQTPSSSKPLAIQDTTTRRPPAQTDATQSIGLSPILRQRCLIFAGRRGAACPICPNQILCHRKQGEKPLTSILLHFPEPRKISKNE